MQWSWFKREDWPLEHEVQRRKNLNNAIKALPNSTSLDPRTVDDLALTLFQSWGNAVDHSGPNFRQASQGACEQEVKKLHQICEKLVEALEGLHQPSVNAFAKEGYSVEAFSQFAQEMVEASRVSFGNIEGEEKRGASLKVIASEVTFTAAQIFEEVTGKAPTVTNDPLTHEKSGPWHDFLGKVFDALWITASVASQERAARVKLSEKNRN